MCAAHSRRVIYSSIRISVRPESAGSIFSFPQKIFACSKAEAIRRAGFDACRLKSYRNAVRAERALVNLLGCRTELRNIERTTGHAVAAADTGIMIEIDDAVAVLNNGARSGARLQATRIHAVHALILGHIPKRQPVRRLR